VVSHRPKAKGKEFSAVLSFPLYHGDITIMHGSRIHGLYEVSCISFALDMTSTDVLAAPGRACWRPPFCPHMPLHGSSAYEDGRGTSQG
jgi:hypothetical protein